jgi:rubrerythrin
MLCWLLGLIGLVKSKKRGSDSDRQDENTSDQTVNVESVQNKQTISENPGFCPNCGTSLNEREPVQYCPYCGVTIGKVITIQT